ncbi:transporter substrate-binding domain-containing protein [Marinobacter arenosus]|uniref:transporter substrate-binding domain-containing protein n=1 Tax=Marinobacter arenosus TaxID=2856822 RepID=UPI001C4A871B|nr:transporter substrate-binding domain-containing protein [Marinobacter arenosus]MBW0147992.1 transporter substrate-binding domain-containing protein [Marinobacter arenosus]
MLKRILSCVFLLALATAGQLHAAETPLKVGITEVPPFVMQTEDGRWEGISIDLWRTVAAGMDRDFEWVPMAFSDLLSATETGEIDVAVGALTMTADREARFDFSHPFYQTGLSIAVPPQPEQSLLASLKALISWQFVSVVLALGALLLAVGFALWLVERRRNPEQFGGSAAQGIGSSFWWAAVTMTTVGYGDKAPVSFAGRLIALVWMFAGLIMVASFTAAITSSLTVSNLRTGIQGADDLPGKVVATINGTASQRYLEEQRIRYQSYPDLTSAMVSVAEGETDAIVYDRALLQYRNQQLGQQQLSILPGIFAEQLYALALPEGRPLRARVSQQILRMTESPDWRDVQASYLGSE